MILAVCVAIGGAAGSVLWLRVQHAQLALAAGASVAMGSLLAVPLQSSVMMALLGFGAFSAAAPMVAVLYPPPDLSTPGATTRFAKQAARRLAVATVVCASSAAAGYLTVDVIVTLLRKLGVGI